MIIIDNRIQVAKLRLAYIVTLLMGIALLAMSPFIGLTKGEEIACQIIGGLLILVFLYLLYIKPQYVYFSVESNSKIVIRNYTALPVFRKYLALEIKISSLQDYEIKNSFFNQISLLRLSVSTNNKIGKYPWLSLSAVPKKDIKSLINFFNKVLPSDKRKEV